MASHSTNNPDTQSGTSSASSTPQAESRWPVVVNSSLQDSDIARMLQQKHKLRYSDTSIPNSCIFPLSSAAFMVLPLNEATMEWPPKSGNIRLDKDIADRLQKFTNVHKNCFLLAMASLHGQHEIAVINEIQSRFMFSPLRILPAHNANDCVQCMTTVAKAMCKSVSSLLKTRLNHLLQQQFTEQTVLNILAQFGLNTHECLVLQQGCETISNVAMASQEQLLDCSLDKETVTTILQFLERDSFAK